MFKIKDWIQACVAGIVFVVAYNLLVLHTSISDAIIKSLFIAVEANLVLYLFMKVQDFLGV